jgi:hypothetical protein
MEPIKTQHSDTAPPNINGMVNVWNRRGRNLSCPAKIKAIRASVEYRIRVFPIIGSGLPNTADMPVAPSVNTRMQSMMIAVRRKRIPKALYKYCVSVMGMEKLTGKSLSLA